MASADEEGTVRLWRTALERQDPVVFRAHRAFISSMSFSPDGAMLATGSVDGTAKLWGLDSDGRQHEIHTFTGHSNTVSSVALSRERKCFATASWDRIARIWNLATFKEERSFTHEISIHAVAFSADGKRLATATEATTPQLNILDGERLMREGRERMRGLNELSLPRSGRDT